MPEEMPARPEDEWPRGTLLCSDLEAGVVFAGDKRGNGMRDGNVIKLFKTWAEAVGFGDRTLILAYGADSVDLEWRQGEIHMRCRVPLHLLSDPRLDVEDAARRLAGDSRRQIRAALEQKRGREPQASSPPSARPRSAGLLL